jgi:uncharacterized membrane protein
MSIDSDTEAIESQLRRLNEQIAEIVALLKEQAKEQTEGPKAEDAPASATQPQENPPNE